MSRPRLVLALALLGTSCGTVAQLVNAFDGPDGAALLEPGPESPFDIPVAFVANTRDGRIIPLDLKRGTLLSDQPASPYLPPRSIATGDQRQLGQVATWSPDGAEVKVFATDAAYGRLLEATYSETLDPGTGAPVPPTLAASEPAFEDVDGNGDSTQLVDLRLRHGWTTTEDWQLEYDGTRWWVTGSRSGKQSTTATFGEMYHSDEKEIQFTLSGTASEGDRISFTTDASVAEHDLGGTPLALVRIAGTDLLAVGIWDGDADEGAVVIWDAAQQAEVGRLTLDEGGQPWRILPTEAADVLYIADARNPRIVRVPFDPTRPDLLIADEIATRGVVMDLALVVEPDDPYTGRPGFDHLFVAGASEARVDVYDRATGEWLDVNPLDGVAGGIDLRSPVVGMSAAPLPIRLQEESDAEIRVEARVVAVTTFDGAIRLIDARTGCQAITTGGPRVSSETGLEQVAFDDVGPESNPTFLTDSATGRQVVPDPCGGVVRAESWTATFDGVEGNWEVEGTASGVQSTRAWPDRRFLTDDGGLSFVILSGTAPATDGDQFAFTMDDGTLRITESIVVGDTSADPVELPARPLAFQMDAGPTGGGWNEDRRQLHLLVPVTNADQVVRIRPQAWQVQAVYE